ncbi:MAG: hypothetical protein JXB35_12310 [Anaerolineae bacterium]|nr:hypothetical protein [Anaerolineae bacterium]
MKYYLGLALVALCALSAGCAFPTFSARAAFKRLEEVKTASEEAEVFEWIWANAESVGFGAYDAAGESVGVGNDAFPEAVHAIQLRINDRSGEYTLVDPANLFILMRE